MVENVFVLPGLGRLIVQSIANRDVLVVENCVMGLAAFVIALNAVVDLAVGGDRSAPARERGMSLAVPMARGASEREPAPRRDPRRAADRRRRAVARLDALSAGRARHSRTS